MAKWSRVISAAAGTLILAIWIPVALAQNYFRYNAYILPATGLLTLLFYGVLFVTTKRVSAKINDFHRGFGAANPLSYAAIVAFIGGSLILLLAGGERYALRKSREHVTELERDDNWAKPAVTKSLPATAPGPALPKSGTKGDRAEKRTASKKAKVRDGLTAFTSAVRQPAPPVSSPVAANGPTMFAIGNAGNGRFQYNMMEVAPTIVRAPYALHFQEEVIDLASADQDDRTGKRINVHVFTDIEIPDPVIGVVFSGGPIDMIGASLNGVPVKSYRLLGSLFTQDKIQIPFSGAMAIDDPSVFRPQQELEISFKSTEGVHVLQATRIPR